MGGGHGGNTRGGRENVKQTPLCSAQSQNQEIMTWVAQVGCPTLGFSPCHDLRVMRSSPVLMNSTLSIKY